MNSLTLSLMSQPRARLQEVLRFWALDRFAQYSQPFTHGLLEAMTDPWRIGDLFERLTQRQRDVIWKLLENRRHQLDAAVLQRQLDIPPAELDAVLEELSAGGLIVVQSIAATWPRARKGQADGSLGSRVVALPVELASAFAAERRRMEAGTAGASLQKSLEQLPVAELQLLASVWDVPKAHMLGRVELVREIGDRIADPGMVEHRLASLGSDPQALFKWLVAAGRTGSLRKATVALGREVVESGSRTLLQNHLVQIIYRDGFRELLIPAEVGSGKRMPRPEPPALVSTPRPAQPADHGFAFAWDLLLILTQLKREPGELRSSDGALNKRSLDRLSRYLSIPEDATHGSRIGFMLNVATELGLLEKTATKLQPGPKFDEWIDFDFGEQLQRLFQHWLQSQSEAGDTVAYYWGVNRPLIRRRLLDRLASWCQPGEWYTVASFLGRLKVADPFIGRSREDVARWQGPQAIDYMLANWDQLDGQMVSHTIAWTLAWLGVTAVGFVEGNKLAFTLTPLGAALLDVSQAGKLVFPNRQSLIVQPNFDVLLLEPSAPALARLGLFADIKMLDRVSTFTITRQSVLAGKEAGLTPDQMIEHLTAHSQKPVPQNVAFSIADWAGQHKPVRLARAVVLEVDDPKVLDELQNSRGVATAIMRRLGPCAALVREDASVRRLATDLRKRGFSPKLSYELENPRAAASVRRGGYY